MLTVGSLFSGIGGFDLGLERAGMQVIWQSEIDPYASAVLRKHWPDVPNHGDVRTISAANVLRPDVLCGGFPCQDISLAGSGGGIDGKRSRLWFEYRRIIEELAPAYAIIENVSALRSRGLDRLLGQIAALGFDAEWHCLPASAVGAPHRRDRVWIIAHANSKRLKERRECDGDAPQPRFEASLRHDLGRCGSFVADADKLARDQGRASYAAEITGGRHTHRSGIGQEWNESRWFVESGMGRVADGVRNRVDRLRCLGNSLVPTIAEILGRAIVSASE